MARRRTVRRDEAAEILDEARRILKDKDAAALAGEASLCILEAALTDDFDESYAAERIADLLAADVWRTLKNRLAQRRSHVRAVEEGLAPVHVRLPAEVAQALTAIAPSPVDAIRQLLDVAVPKPGSEAFCRNHLCCPEVPLAQPERWACATCGMAGRADWPLNPYMEWRLTGAVEKATALRDIVADLYSRFPNSERFTLASWVAVRLCAFQDCRLG